MSNAAPWDRKLGGILEEFGTKIWKATVEKSEIGLVPKEYNKAVHGPYEPGRFYGKPDPLSEAKVGEIGSWLKRRPKGFTPLARLISRAHWRWHDRFMAPRMAGMTGIYQFGVAMMVAYYFINYTRLKAHRQYRYH